MLVRLFCSLQHLSNQRHLRKSDLLSLSTEVKRTKHSKSIDFFASNQKCQQKVEIKQYSIFHCVEQAACESVQDKFVWRQRKMLWSSVRSFWVRMRKAKKRSKNNCWNIEAELYVSEPEYWIWDQLKEYTSILFDLSVKTQIWSWVNKRNRQREGAGGEGVARWTVTREKIASGIARRGIKWKREMEGGKIKAIVRIRTLFSSFNLIKY